MARSVDQREIPSKMGSDSLDRGLAEAFGPTSVQRDSVLGELNESHGAVPRVLLRDTHLRSWPDPVVQPGSDEMPAPSDRSGRLQLLGEIARGGMGAVLKGRDTDLGRDLAIKVLLDRHRDRPEMVRRFIEEAQIGGQLQHPGIVPVYELGQFADHRPFFVMKLVKGHTLAALLEEREVLAPVGRGSPDAATGATAHLHSDGPTPGLDPQHADLPRFLSIFEAICRTVAYAHARGVIHRDLKPSNVMVGAFGEVQVMDWGLAKVLPQGGATDDAQAGKVARNDTVIATARSGGEDPDLSEAGSVMGTPSYMAPEQARGDIEAIDERADVFALGSILCEMLTGEPAFTGPNAGAIQRKASRGEVAEALARLATCGADGELIALATSCLAAEPEERLRHAGVVSGRITSHLAGVQEKLRRAELARVEERARRRLTVGAAAAILVIAGVTGGGWYWIEQGRQSRRATALAALAEARLLGEQARRARMDDPDPWAAALMAAKQADWLAKGAGERALQREAEVLHAKLEAGQQQAEAERKLLSELEDIRLGQAERIDWKRADAEFAAAFRTAGLDVDAVEPREAGRWISGRAHPVELASYVDDWALSRRAAERPDPDWQRLVAVARVADPDPWRDQLRANIASGATAAAALRKLADDEKSTINESAVSLLLLARQLRNGLKDSVRAEAVLKKAWALYPGDFWINLLLAHARGFDSTSGNRDMFTAPQETVRYLTTAVALRPGSFQPHILLGDALRASRKTHEALGEYRQAIRLKPDSALAHNNLGGALRDLGKLAEAVGEYREATRLQPGYAVAQTNLSVALRDLWTVTEATAGHREAIQRQPDFAVARNNFGDALRDQGELAKATMAYREAIRLKPDYAEAHFNLGVALRDQGSFHDAIAELREAIRLRPEYAEAHANLGIALRAQGKIDEAIAEYRTAIRLTPDYAFAHNSLGVALSAQGKLNEAVAQFRAAIMLKPDDASTHCNLGVALTALSRLTEAAAEYREALRLKDDDVDAHNNLARLLATHPEPPLRELAKALWHGRKAVELGPKNGKHFSTLGLVEYRCGHLAAARSALETSMKLQGGGDAYDWLILALIDARQGRSEQAQAWYDKSMAWIKKNRTDSDLVLIWSEAAEQLDLPGPGNKGRGADSPVGPPAPG